VCGGDGSDVRLAQHIFAGVYLLNAAVLHRVYRLCLAPKPSPSSNFLYLAAISLLSLSKRLHSIYVLRCFNDTVSTLLLNASLLLFLTPMKHRNHAASLAYSLSVSVKMNTLLYAPAVLLHYLQVRRPPPFPAHQVHL
jgi:alpha-1,3-mannosyltransferase